MGLLKKAAIIGGGVWAVKKISHRNDNHREIDRHESQGYYGEQNTYHNANERYDAKPNQSSPPYMQQGANASYYSQPQWSQYGKS